MLGRVESIWRYPVKSMRGEEVDEIFVAFTGLMGDRVYAIASTAAPTSFPWHTAREQEDLVLYQARFKERGGTLKPDNMEEAMGHPANVHAPFPEAEAFAVEVERPDGSVVDIEDPAFLDGIKDKVQGRALAPLHPTQPRRLPAGHALFPADSGTARPGDRHRRPQAAVPRQLLRRLDEGGRLLRGRAGGPGGSRWATRSS